MGHRKPVPRPSGAVDPTLVQAIEYIPVPAFVVSMAGVVLASNASGHRWLAGRPERSRTLTHPRGPNPKQFAVTMSTDRRPGYYLAVLRPVQARLARRELALGDDTSDAHARVVTAARRWGLTPRQAQVLEQLANGMSNAQIATLLGCAEATVEIHVSRVLDRAGVDSRAGLLATLLWGT